MTIIETFMTKADLPAAIIRSSNEGKQRICCYVGVPEGFSTHGMSHSDIQRRIGSDLRLTFSGLSIHDDHNGRSRWWFGTYIDHDNPAFRTNPDSDVLICEELAVRLDAIEAGAP